MAKGKVSSGVNTKTNDILGTTEYYGWARRGSDDRSYREGPDRFTRWRAKIDAWLLARKV